MKRAFTLIELMIVIAIIAIISAIFIPNLLEIRKSGNEMSAISSLRAINASMAVYIERNPAQRYGTLTDLETDGYVDNVLGSGTKAGYKFTVNLSFDPILKPGSLDPQYEYSVSASPVILGQTGNRYFETNQGGLVYFLDAADIGSGAPFNPRPVGLK
jgi:type IV pilus assembly protein PilA